MMPFRTVLALSVLVLAAPAMAHHRQTDPVVALTFSGNTPLPRVPAPGTKTLALAVESGAGRRIVSLSPFRDRTNPAAQTVVAEAGDHANPAVSRTGRVFAFDTGSDPLGSGLPGRQVIAVNKGESTTISGDPTGTSINASVDSTGRYIAFESTGDLAGTGNAGVRQVFVRDQGGNVRQFSQGLGTSRHAVLSPKKWLIAFESSSDATTGADTGISQIWLGNVVRGDAAPITAGSGPSRNPAVADDGRVVAFESTAALAGSGADTGVPQIYIYETKRETYARITNEAQGCTLPSVFKVQRDYRVAFTCSGTPYFTMLRADQRYLVAAPGGTTQRIVAELGSHFLILSTRADLVGGGGATPGNQVYLVNLFKRPGTPVAGNVTWFPTQGLSPL